MPIVSNESCKKMFFRAGRHEVIPHIFMCAGYDNGGRDSCQVKELKERTMEKEEDLEQEETTGREDVDDFRRASKNSLKLLDLWKQTLRGPEK